MESVDHETTIVPRDNEGLCSRRNEARASAIFINAPVKIFDVRLDQDFFVVVILFLHPEFLSDRFFLLDKFQTKV